MELKSREYCTVPQRDLLQKKLDKLTQRTEKAIDRLLNVPDSMLELAERKVREYQEETNQLKAEIATLDLQSSDLEQPQEIWEAQKDEFLQIDERLTYTDNEHGGMFPQKMRRVRAKVEKARFACFLQDRGLQVTFYWRPVETSPQRIRHQARKTLYQVDRARVNSRVAVENPINTEENEDKARAGGAYQ
tara:strand:- start:29 stop:598 length:570 start_codon:yes stop_codon:yes gene_type:complete